MGVEGGEAFVGDEGGDFFEGVAEGGLAIEVVFLGVGEGTADGADLGVVDELGKEGEIDFLATETQGTGAVGFDVLAGRSGTAIATALVAAVGGGGFEGVDGVGVGDALEGGMREGKCETVGGARELFGLLGEVLGEVVVHGEDAVGGAEVVAGAAEDEDGGDPMIVVERADALDEGGDGFLFRGDELLHAFVADEEVGGGDVFV